MQSILLQNTLRYDLMLILMESLDKFEDICCWHNPSFFHLFSISVLNKDSIVSFEELWKLSSIKCVRNWYEVSGSSLHSWVCWFQFFQNNKFQEFSGKNSILNLAINFLSNNFDSLFEQLFGLPDSDIFNNMSLWKVHILDFNSIKRIWLFF